MEEINTIGIDLAKRRFQLRGSGTDGLISFRERLSPANALNFLTFQPSCVVALGLLLLFFATGAAAQAQERNWNVICGLPQQENPILDLLPTGGYSGPWLGDPSSGHLEVKTLNRPHPESGLSTEMWLLSRSVGWWMLKSIRVHPDDLPKLTENTDEDASWPEIRQIIESPLLSQPAVVRAMNPEDEELVNGQVFALLPDASRLQCTP